MGLSGKKENFSYNHKKKKKGVGVAPNLPNYQSK